MTFSESVAPATARNQFINSFFPESERRDGPARPSAGLPGRRHSTARPGHSRSRLTRHVRVRRMVGRRARRERTLTVTVTLSSTKTLLTKLEMPYSGESGSQRAVRHAGVTVRHWKARRRSSHELKLLLLSRRSVGRNSLSIPQDRPSPGTGPPAHSTQIGGCGPIIMSIIKFPSPAGGPAGESDT